jgi:hypothetical protein
MRQGTIRRHVLRINDASSCMALTVHTATVSTSSRSDCQRIFRRLWRREQRRSRLGQKYQRHYRVEVQILPKLELYWTLLRTGQPDRINGGIAGDLQEVSSAVYLTILRDRTSNGAIHDDSSAG